MSRTEPLAALQQLAARAAQRLDAGLHRRGFLQLGAAALAATQVGALTGCAPEHASEAAPLGVSATGARVAIVGGGLAGVHCAWRLRGTGLRVELFEAGQRLGGRALTARGLFGDAQQAELGAERFEADHLALRQLTAELGLTARPLAVNGTRFQVGGVDVAEDTLVAQLADVLPAVQADVDAAESDGAAFDGLDHTDLGAWLDDRVPADVWPELHAALAAAARAELCAEPSQLSALPFVYALGAAAALPTGGSPWTVGEGVDALVDRMAADLPTAPRLGHRLLRVGGVEADGRRTLTFAGPDGTFHARYDRVVLALPFAVLRTIDLADADLPADVRWQIDTLGQGHAARVLAHLHQRPWSPTAPTRLLSDDLARHAWHATADQPGAGAILTHQTTGEDALAVEAGDAARWFRDAVLPEVEVAWPGVRAAWDGRAVRTRWSSSPLTRGARAVFTPGQAAMWGQLGAPVVGLHFCGEHVSADAHGRLEGAAETSLRVAAELVGAEALGPAAARLLAAMGALPAVHPGREASPSWRARRHGFTALAATLTG